MELIKSTHCDINYLARIVNVKEFEPHPNPEVTRLKLVAIGGYKVIVGIDSQPGYYVYFPALSQINPEFLSFANLYRHSEKNANPEKTGLFEDSGKVTAIKLKGQVSEGFLIEFSILNNWCLSTVNKEIIPVDNEEFDSVQEGTKTFWINRKYIIPYSQKGANAAQASGKTRQAKKGLDRVIPEQFRFHYSTVIIKKCPYVVQPEDLISITSKWHGTSGISAYVLCHTKHTWSIGKKIANFFARIFKNPISDIDYDYIYASRTVIKNQFANPTEGFYGVDVWKYADDVVRPHLTKGMTAYYEICGFLPDGKYIQKNYDYGCVPPSDDHYTEGVNFKVMIYRLTLTDPDGRVHEFSAREVQQWCTYNGLTPVHELYYGYAKDLYLQLMQDVNGSALISTDWCNQFIEALANDKERFYMEANSPDCKNKVPHEGLVIKTEKMKSEAWKLKCFAFLKGELTETESNIEDNA